MAAPVRQRRQGPVADFAYSKSDDLFRSWLSKQYEKLSADDLLQAWVAKQGGNDFTKATDPTVIHYPFKSGTSRYPDETAKWRQLAHEICPDDDANDYVKARALFGWMQSNIAYDRDILKATGGDNTYRWASSAASGSAKGYTMWDSHVGKCVDFINTYAVMCRELGIPCHVVSIPCHGFNVAYLKGRWEIVDVNTGLREAHLGADNKDYAANVEAYWAKEDAKGGHTPVWNGFCDTAASKFKVGSYEKNKYTGVGDKMAKTLNELNYELIPLSQPNRCTNSQGQTLQQTGAKATAAETEAIFVEVGLEVLLGQAMVSTQNERFGVADHDVQSMEQT